ncbi:MAG: GGDEF domain-containing protein [Acidimicrobiales bacterium]
MPLPVRQALRTLEIVRLELPDELATDGGLVAFRPRSVLTMPLHLRTVPVGVVIVASANSITDEDERLLTQLSPNLAVALNNALGHERLQQVAAIDPLTGLYNRRFGMERLGEEFLIVLPGAGVADVKTLGQRVRRAIEATEVDIGTTMLNATVSVGAVAFPSTDVVDIDDLVRNADAEMYAAKSSGRNRLALAS